MKKVFIYYYFFLLFVEHFKLLNDRVLVVTSPVFWNKENLIISIKSRDITRIKPSWGTMYIQMKI